jgi:hypothetical protein
VNERLKDLFLEEMVVPGCLTAPYGPMNDGNDDAAGKKVGQKARND